MNVVCTHGWVAACVCARERTLYVLKWRSERSLALQLSAGFRSLYSLFAWLTLDALIATRWLFLVFYKVGRTPRERLWEHMGESCRQSYCGSQRSIQAQAPSIAPPSPHLFLLATWGSVSHNTWNSAFVKPVLLDPRYEYRRNRNTDGENSSPKWARFTHVFIPSATFYLQKAVCLWSDYRTQHTHCASMWVCLRICVCASIMGQGLCQCVWNTLNNFYTISALSKIMWEPTVSVCPVLPSATQCIQKHKTYAATQ